MLVAVAGTISLPEVWLREGPTVAPPDWVFDSQPSQLGEWVCVADDCVMARNSLVTNADGSVAWVINPDNPLTRLARDDQGRDEDVRIASIQVVSGRIHVLLESGRVVTRTRDGTWRPGVGAFRESIAVSLVIAWLALFFGCAWASPARAGALPKLVWAFSPPDSTIIDRLCI